MIKLGNFCKALKGRGYEWKNEYPTITIIAAIDVRDTVFGFRVFMGGKK